MSAADFKVSVIIPVFNMDRYLTDAVESAVRLPETGEIILVDDGSTDNSLALCLSLQNKYEKVRVLQHPERENHGVAASRNLGIKNAHFDYISFLDADDYYLSNRFQTDKEIFLACANVDGVYGCNEAVFENPEIQANYLNRYVVKHTTVSHALPPAELYRSLLFLSHGCFHTSAITIRKEAFAKTGLFNTKLRQGEDTELWLKLSLKSVLVAGSIKEPIAIRRVHNTNSIHNVEKVHFYARKAYQSLFDWVVLQPYSFEIKNSFFIALHQSISTDKDVQRFFWKQVRKRPQIIFSLFFVKKLHQLYFI